MFIEEDIDFVKSQIAHHQKTIPFLQSKNLPEKARRHEGLLRRFNEHLAKIEKTNELIVSLESYASELNSKIQEMESDTSKPISFQSTKIGNRLGDITTLPEELRSQLVSVQFDKAEQQILEVIKTEFSGVATIDEILVGLYRVHDFVENREQLAQRIYRMSRKELLKSVEGKKGVYSIFDLSDEEERTSQD